MKKSTLINITALSLVVISFYMPNEYKNYLYYSGLFALSGAVTNQIAIFMLFNKIPFLYGSGVIEINFEKFKTAIKNMIMEQFFTKERLQNFFKEEENKIDFAPIIEKTNFNVAFDALKESVMESKFGQLINMFGGEDSLEVLRESFNTKLKDAVIKIVSSNTFKKQLDAHLQNSPLSEDLIQKVEHLIQARLQELGPKSVKELINKLIKEHLEWLVVWGGVFGGIIGFVSVFLKSI